MMASNNIEFDYNGFCEILDWNRFLDLHLDIVINVAGSDSLKFYNAKDQYCFYAHHSFSVGIYFKEMNESLKNVLKKSSEEGAKIEFINLRE